MWVTDLYLAALCLKHNLYSKKYDRELRADVKCVMAVMDPCRWFGYEIGVTLDPWQPHTECHSTHDASLNFNEIYTEQKV